MLYPEVPEGEEQLAEGDENALCFHVLGKVHSRWTPLPRTLKDYISSPKPNGYRSLHTTVLGPKAQQIDVFLRTRQMDEVAQEGVVAYWRAQEHSGGAQLADGEIDGRWLDVLRGISSAADSADDFIVAARMELFPDQVFCFTPRGDLIQLPRGSACTRGVRRVRRSKTWIRGRRRCSRPPSLSFA